MGSRTLVSQGWEWGDGMWLGDGAEECEGRRETQQGMCFFSG